MVRNFIEFPPLGVVIVCMLGVGVAERTGLIAAALKALMLVVPRRLLTPMVVFIGVNASLAADAGFIVLPPLAALLYKRAGRSPLAGIAAAFAGVAGGFSANLFITSLDPLLSTLTQSGARIIDPAAVVNPACNWWFMIAATFLITLVGWPVSSLLVEPRLAARPPDQGGAPIHITTEARIPDAFTSTERRALAFAAATFAAAAAILLASALIPGAPLFTQRPTDPAGSARWIAVIVPIIFTLFLFPGLAYGRASGSLARFSDVARLMAESVASLAPMLVLAFFAAQFIAYFKYTNLDRMLAFSVGKQLSAADLSPTLLLVALVVVVMALDMLMASASAKWSLLAPIFVPMFMLLGIGPAATQAAYRIGDSVTNPITPLNPYMVIVLLAVQRYAPKARTGTILAMQAPFAITFACAWLLMLLAWTTLGFDFGPGGPVLYQPSR